MTVAADALEDQGVLDLIKSHEGFIIKDLKDELISCRSISNKRRLEYLISTFSSNDRVKMDQISEQGGADQPPTALESKSQDKEKAKPESEGRSR